MFRLIGTKNETSLHKELKFAYASKYGQTETEISGFVADGINSQGEVIEVQTGSFKPLTKKLPIIAKHSKIRVIYPIIISKYIEVYNVKGEKKYRRKSPKKGSAWDLFDALVHAPDLPLIKGVTIELVVIDALEQRVDNGKGSWRRRGISIKDRSMLVLHKKIILKNPKDYLKFVPFKKKEAFTSASLAERSGIKAETARKTLYVLCKLGIIEKIAKERNAIVYQIAMSK